MREREEYSKIGKTGDLFKKTGNTKEIFHVKIGKGQKRKDLTENLTKTLLLNIAMCCFLIQAINKKLIQRGIVNKSS